MKTTHLFNKIKSAITFQKDEMPANAIDLWDKLENRLTKINDDGCETAKSIKQQLNG